MRLPWIKQHPSKPADAIGLAVRIAIAHCR